MHLYKRLLELSGSESFPTFTDLLEGNHQYSEKELVESEGDIQHALNLLFSSEEKLSPRGMKSAFAGWDSGLALFDMLGANAASNAASSSSPSTAYTLSHDVYVWNGRDSAALTRAIALTKGYELERLLLNDRLGIAESLYQGAANKVISFPWYKFLHRLKHHDADKQQLARLYERNHLVRLLFCNQSSSDFLRVPSNKETNALLFDPNPPSSIHAVATTLPASLSEAVPTVPLSPPLTGQKRINSDLTAA